MVPQCMSSKDSYSRVTMGPSYSPKGPTIAGTVQNITTAVKEWQWKCQCGWNLSAAETDHSSSSSPGNYKASAPQLSKMGKWLGCLPHFCCVQVGKPGDPPEKEVENILPPAGMNEGSCVKVSSGTQRTGKQLANKSSFILLVSEIVPMEIQLLLKAPSEPDKFKSFSPLHSTLRDLLHKFIGNKMVWSRTP